MKKVFLFNIFRHALNSSTVKLFTEYVTLGNLDSKRDWGHAKDYVEGMWMMMQQDEFVAKLLKH